MQLTASLVLYNNDPCEFEIAIQSFLDGSNGFLYILDNSETPLCHPLFLNPRVFYKKSSANLGFGRAHNLAFKNISHDSDIHLFMNPDVKFESTVLPELIGFLGMHPEIGALMPRIEYRDGSLQRLCKLLPTPLDLVVRRFLPIKQLRNWINRRYEMHWLGQDRSFDVPSLSACFLLVRSKDFRYIGGFDERYFMYLEDVDLVRRIGEFKRTVYYPLAHIVHGYARGSYKNTTLLYHHLRSAIAYFSKWGWWHDQFRAKKNKAALALRQ